MAVESGSYTPETIARRLKMAEELMAPRKRPIIHWAQGLEDLANTAVGAMEFRKAERQEDAMEKAQALAWAKLMGGGGGAGADVPPIAPAAAAGAPGPVAGVAPPTRMAALTPDVPLPAPPKPPIDPNTLPVMNLTDPRVTPLGETIERLPPAPRPGPAVAGLPGAPMPMPSAGPPVAAALNAPAAPVPPAAVPPPVPPVAAALNAPTAGAPGGDMRAQIANMLQTGNRAERRMAAKLAPIIAAKQLEGEKPTDEMREYQLYRTQGGTKSFVDYKTDLAKARAQNISMETKVETEREKLAAKRFDALNSEITSSAASARSKMNTLDRLGSLLDDPTVKTGKGQEAILEMKRLAQTMGFDVGNLGPAEAARAISNQFVLELRNPSGGAGMPGAMSDADRVFLAQGAPGLLQGPEGNRIIIDYSKRMAQRSLDVERLRRDYIKKNKHLDEGFYDVLSNFADKNPLFPEANQRPAPAATAPQNNDPLGIR